MYDGIGGCIETAVEHFFNKYAKYILKAAPFEVPDLDGERVYQAFSKIAKSAGAMDGWSLEELALLSRGVCCHIAEILNLVENGAPWPQSAPHARAVFLQKDGTMVGQVTSYRILTITSPLYRAWASMRLDDMHMWVRSWALPEMYAGVPEKGAVDAWREVLTKAENMKLDNTNYCGGVADIAKFFDQVRRTLLYQMAEAAGMPPKVLRAYKAYLEELVAYNALAGGIGLPQKRKCGIPQGCPPVYGHGSSAHAAMDHADEKCAGHLVLHSCG